MTQTLPTIDAIVLAAGEGTRLGRPKAHLLLGETPLVAAHVHRALDAGCRRVLVVVRQQDASWAKRFAEVVVSHAPDPAGSLRVGLDALSAIHDRIPPADAVLITPVDALPAQRSTIAALYAAIADGAQAATPSRGGVGGHPVLLRWDSLDAFRVGVHVTLRDQLTALGAGRRRIVVDDPAVGTDLDTRADVLAATGSEPVFIDDETLDAARGS